jgi:hypothetical protein
LRTGGVADGLRMLSAEDFLGTLGKSCGRAVAEAERALDAFVIDVLRALGTSAPSRWEPCFVTGNGAGADAGGWLASLVDEVRVGPPGVRPF